MAKSRLRILKPDDPIFHGGVQAFKIVSRPHPMQGAVDSLHRAWIALWRAGG